MQRLMDAVGTDRAPSSGGVEFARDEQLPCRIVFREAQRDEGPCSALVLASFLASDSWNWQRLKQMKSIFLIKITSWKFFFFFVFVCYKQYETKQVFCTAIFFLSLILKSCKNTRRHGNDK